MDVDAERAEELRLVAGLQGGDPAAFDTAYARHRQQVFGFLARLCRDRVLAEDLLQETWLRLARFAPRLADDTRLSLWLLTVARNLYRSHRRRSLLELDRGLTLGRWALTEPDGPSPFDMAAAGELEREVDRALGCLSLPFREILLLTAVQRLPPADAAAVLSLSPAAFRKRLSRARKALAEALHVAPVKPHGAPGALYEN